MKTMLCNMIKLILQTITKSWKHGTKCCVQRLPDELQTVQGILWESCILTTINEIRKVHSLTTHHCRCCDQVFVFNGQLMIASAMSSPAQADVFLSTQPPLHNFSALSPTLFSSLHCTAVPFWKQSPIMLFPSQWLQKACSKKEY